MTNDKFLVKIESALKVYYYNYDELIDHANKLLAVADMLKQIRSCPYVLDEASVPKGGIDKNEQQVVGQISCAYVRYIKLCELSDKLEQ